ncbi:unnamed protein product [Knipowitschia caucasica]|uniref:IQ domain-containing protein C n=1 Tax=Knipowitschia caucasica TaxID=637954 RepID=A0AAV2JIW1_KNICA
MDETRRLEWIICHFQARARGYLFRKELRRAREDYEDIVKEIDGDLRCLKWIKRVVHFPYFVDIDLSQNNKIHDNFENAKSEGTECPGSAEFGSSREEDGCGFSEKLEAERDISQTLPPRELLSSSSGDAGDMLTGGGDVREKEEGVTETPCDTTVWSSVDTDLGSSHSTKAALRQYCLARDVPRTPQALCVHRNTLSMELLWLQQAIHSRKKYLSLKKQLSVS